MKNKIIQIANNFQIEFVDLFAAFVFSLYFPLSAIDKSMAIQYVIYVFLSCFFMGIINAMKETQQ